MVIASGTALTANRTYYVPFYVNKTTTFDRIACVTTSAFSGTATVRLGIYNHDGANKPSTVLLDAGTVSATAASTAYTITISQSLSAGTYWLAMNTQTTATTNTFFVTSSTPTMTFNQWYNGANGSTLISGWVQDSVTGAFATAGTLTGAVTLGAARVRAQ